MDSQSALWILRLKAPPEGTFSKSWQYLFQSMKINILDHWRTSWYFPQFKWNKRKRTQRPVPGSRFTSSIGRGSKNGWGCIKSPFVIIPA